MQPEVNPNKILLVPIEMKNQRDIEPGECFIELKKDGWIHYKMDFKHRSMIDKEDEGMGWKDDSCYIEMHVPFWNIGSVHVSQTTFGQWCMEIDINGSAMEIQIYFTGKQKNKAMELFGKAYDWWHLNLKNK